MTDMEYIRMRLAEGSERVEPTDREHVPLRVRFAMVAGALGRLLRGTRTAPVDPA